MLSADTFNVTDDERRRALIGAARESFLKHGYAATTMSSIAAAVKGSKAVLWTYFPSKEQLFAAVMDDISTQYGHALSVELPSDQPPEIVLRHFGNALLETLTAPVIVNLHRLVIGEANRFPELAQVFYQHGEKRGTTRVADYITGAMQRGELKIGDAITAARHFSALCKAGSFHLFLLSLTEKPARDLLEKDVDIAVDTFLHGWAARNPKC